MKRERGKEALMSYLDKRIKSCKDRRIKKVLRMILQNVKVSKETKIKDMLFWLRDFASFLSEARKKEKAKMKEIYHERIS